jgi:hypothetical protein
MGPGLGTSHCDARAGRKFVGGSASEERSIGSENMDAAELVLENDRLGGREARLDAVEEDHLFSPASDPTLSDLVLTSDSGRKNDTVLALLSTGLSTFSSSSTGFLISGSLCSNFPFLSDAKYSSPRPNTT